MSSEKLTIQQLREYINRGEAKDPLIFLESIMAGYDLRRLSSIYELVMEIDAFSNSEPSKSDWIDIVDHVNKNHKYHTVSLSESLAASKTLAEYLHPKRKQIDISENNNSNPNNDPLTPEEIALFKERFNAEY